MDVCNQTLDLQEHQRLERLMLFEYQAQGLGYTQVAGVDEAGRGPLAGPVVAAACILPIQARFSGINDSKQLTRSLRQALFQQICEMPGLSYAVGIVESDVIDQINILKATFKAMRIAIDALKPPPDYLLVDGPHLPSTCLSGRALIKGDALSQSIAAASIIAKETRDQIMCQYHLEFPEYDFDRHMGYGTPGHLRKLIEHGPCRIHRRSFAPLKML